MCLTLKVFKDVLKVVLFAKIKLQRRNHVEGNCNIPYVQKYILVVDRRQTDRRIRGTIPTYMGVLLVQLLIVLLQNVVWISNVLLYGHGLRDEQLESTNSRFHQPLLSDSRVCVCVRVCVRALSPSLWPSP